MTHSSSSCASTTKAAKLIIFAGNEGVDAETWLFQAQQRFLLENIDPLLYITWIAQHLTREVTVWWIDQINDNSDL